MTEVVFLLLIGIALIGLNVNAIKKEKKSFSGALKDKENNMQDYEIEIGKLRRDLSETVLELQQEIEALKVTRESNNIKEVTDENELEDKEFYKNLYGRSSDSDEKIINRDLKAKSVEKQPEENFEEEVNAHQSEKLHQEDKNEIEHKSVKDTETLTASNVEEQNKDQYEKETEKQNTENYNNTKDQVGIKEEKMNKNPKQNYPNNKNQRKKTNSNKKYSTKTKNQLNIYEKVDENNKSDEDNKASESNKSSENNAKVTEIRTLLDQGVSVDEIAEKIGKGKGEVLLIKELYIK